MWTPKRTKSATQRLVRVAAIAALAVLLHVVESALPPLPLPVPGARLGLANVAAVFTLYAFGPLDALLVTALRVLLGSLFGGTALTALYAMSGGLCAAGCMMLAKGLSRGRLALSPVGVSVAGSFGHGLGQIAAASFVTRSYALLLYLPALTLIGIPTGVFIGLCAHALLTRPGFLKQM